MDKLNLIDFDKYTITRDGKIFSNYFKKYLKGYLNPKGYIYIRLSCFDGKGRLFLLHRVIWYYFNGEIPSDYDVNHIDENKTNNALCNLNLLTRKDNNNWGTHNERMKKNLTNHPNTSKRVAQINLSTGEIIKEWPSTRDVGRQLGFNSSTISKVCRGILSQSAGYGWKYI